jgi:ribosomal protein L29
MVILRLKEIDNISQEDRNRKLTELRAELSRMRTMIRAGGAVENFARIVELRKTIAQILTIESEQKRGIRQKQAKTEKQPKKTKKKKDEQPKKETKETKTSKKSKETKKTAEAEATKETKKA